MNSAEASTSSGIPIKKNEKKRTGENRRASEMVDEQNTQDSLTTKKLI